MLVNTVLSGILWMKQFPNLVNIKNKMSLWLILFISFSSFSQVLQHPYTKYYGIGVTIGKNYFKEGSITSEVLNSEAFIKQLGINDFSAGINYNFFFNNKFYLNLAFGGQLFEERKKIKYDNDSFIPARGEGSGKSFIISLPITALYTYQIIPKLSANVGGGFGLSYYRYSGLTVSSGGNGISSIEVRESNSSNPIYPSAHIELSLGFEFGKVLLQPKIMYSKSFKSYRRGTYQFYNLPNEPDFGGTIDQSGDYFGFNLGIRFKKRDKS